MDKILLSLLACVFLCLAQAARAEEIQPLGMVTGPATGTYIAFGKDIAKVSAQEGTTLEVTASTGSIDNIRRIAEANENAAIGIVQSDVLSFLKRSQNPRSKAIAEHLRLIFPFYSEEVHVLARNEVKDFKELEGKRVVVGQPGSGNMLTAVNLLALAQIKPSKMLQMPPEEGVVSVLAGEADAVIFTAGKPVTLFSNLEQMRTDFDGKYATLLNQVHFLPVEGKEIESEYNKAEITPADYSFVKKKVPTVAVTSLLVAYDFSSEKNDYYKTRCTQLESVGRAIRTHLSWLKENGHPKWKEVDPQRPVALWQREECSWVNAQMETPSLSSELERDLLGIVHRTAQR